MFKAILKETKTAFLILLVFTILIGFGYTGLITGIANIFFPNKSNGSLIMKDGKIIGSKLIGQDFSEAKYFWGRPSATNQFPYNSLTSGGSNLGPLNSKLLENVKDRIALLQNADPENQDKIPIDLVTASGSGLDPDISPAAAYYQVARIAKARGASIAEVTAILKQHIQKRQFYILGEPRVNILELNLNLDKVLGPSDERQTSQS